MQAKNRLKELERNSPYPYGKFIGSEKITQMLLFIRNI
jgi:hypothetical protein